MSPDWERLIRAHAEPIRGEGFEEERLFSLKRGIVAMTVTTRSAGSGRSPRGQGVPFLFHRAASPEGTERITLDLSHDDFLIFRKTETYSVVGQTHQVVHKHCIPWDNITEIEFMESSTLPD